MYVGFIYMFNLWHIYNTPRIKRSFSPKINHEELSFCLSIQRTKSLRVGEAGFLPKEEGRLPAAPGGGRARRWAAGMGTRDGNSESCDAI